MDTSLVMAQPGSPLDNKIADAVLTGTLPASAGTAPAPEATPAAPVTTETTTGDTTTTTTAPAAPAEAK